MTPNDRPYPTPEATVTRNALSPSNSYADATAWTAIVTAARTARLGWFPARTGDAISIAVAASHDADALTAQYGSTERAWRGTGLGLDVGFHGPAASWTLARWEAHRYARQTASMGVYVLGDGRIIG